MELPLSLLSVFNTNVICICFLTCFMQQWLGVTSAQLNQLACALHFQSTEPLWCWHLTQSLMSLIIGSAIQILDTTWNINTVLLFFCHSLVAVLCLSKKGAQSSQANHIFIVCHWRFESTACKSTKLFMRNNYNTSTLLYWQNRAYQLMEHTDKNATTWHGPLSL